jgi:hypothetical protein
MFAVKCSQGLESEVCAAFQLRPDLDSNLFAVKCSQGGIRTPDRVVNSHLLYRLSYLGI